MTRFNTLTKIQMVVMVFFANAIVWAQSKGADLNVDVDVKKPAEAMGGDWMSNPLVWVIGALVLILIIALVARGGGNK